MLWEVTDPHVILEVRTFPVASYPACQSPLSSTLATAANLSASVASVGLGGGSGGIVGGEASGEREGIGERKNKDAG